jgi:hypothetical protein
MAIRVKQMMEPFARPVGKFDFTKYVAPAKSRVARQIADDMELYALGLIPGRSFLVAGHRGSGKTSAVNIAIKDAEARLRQSETDLKLCIADIRLHGPDLLAQNAPGQTPAEQAGKAGGGQPPARPDGKEDLALRDTRQMLRQITLALYRKIADVFTESYRKRLLEANGDDARDAAERAAQFCLDLDRAPDIALLRDYWAEADAVHCGVLYPSDSARPHRGLNELIALACAAQAYQLVLGELKVTEKGNESEKEEEKSELKLGGAGIKELTTPLLSAFAGGAAGVAGFASTSSAVAAIALGFLTAGLTAGALQYANARSREASRSREVTFLPDTRVESLDRMLPVLVDRVRDCGIVPVFVVDELDKVTDLVTRIEDLVRHLKHFVTERAFFCFLSDRDFYEALLRLSIDQPYPKEHTYFSDRLLLHFSPGELHEYLSKALAGDQKEDEQAAEVLRYIVLHRARSHPFDVRQRLNALQGETDYIRLGNSEILNSQAHRIDVTMQIAVELVLRDKLITDQLSSNPEFMLLACDALYYPSRTWTAGEAALNLSQEAFYEYLGSRLGVQDIRGSEPEILHRALLKLVNFLADPERLRREAYETGGFSAAAIETTYRAPLFVRAGDGVALSSEALDARLVRDGDSIRWSYDIFGRPLAAQPAAPPRAPARPPAEADAAIASPGAAPPGEPEAPAPPLLTAEELDRIKADIGWVRQRAQFVRDASEDFFNLRCLAVDFRLIAITPSWEGVESAMSRLQQCQPNRTPYATFEEDVELLREYRRMIESRWLAILQSLLLTAFLGVYSGTQDKFGKWRMGMEELARMLRFETDPATKVDQRLEKIIGEALPPMMGRPPSPLLEGDRLEPEISLDDYQARIAGVWMVPNGVLEAAKSWAVERFWELWWKRFASARAGTTMFEPELPDVLLWVTGYPPAHWLSLDLSKVTVRAWSHLVLEGDQTQRPYWVIAPAMALLGFRDKLDRPPAFMKLQEVELREFRAWAGSTRSDTPPGIFFLLTPSVVPDEAPYAGAPCFAVDTLLYPSLLTEWMDWLRSDLGIRKAFVELDENGRAPIELVTMGSDAVDVAYVCSVETDRLLQKANWPIPKPRIVAPKSYAEALAMSSPDKKRRSSAKA